MYITSQSQETLLDRILRIVYKVSMSTIWNLLCLEFLIPNILKYDTITIGNTKPPHFLCFATDSFPYKTFDTYTLEITQFFISKGLNYIPV